MKAIKKVTPEQISKARKAGIKAKKPKKKAFKTLNSAENYIERYNAWADKIHSGAKYYEMKLREKKQLEKAKAAIAGI